MKLKRLACFLMVWCILLCSAGCGKQNPKETEPSGNNADSQGEITIDQVDFSGLPAMNTDMVRVYPAKGILLFEYITPGMDSYESTLIAYSLTENKMLGRVDLGDGGFFVHMDSNGEFSVFDSLTGKGTYYSSNCQVKKTVTINCIDGATSFIAAGGEKDRLLVSEMRTGSLYLVTPDGKEKTKVDLNTGFYEMVGCTDGRFVVMENAQKVFVIEQDGSARELFSKGGVNKVNPHFAAGLVGDYLAFLPLDRGDCLFTKINDPEESLLAAGPSDFLSLSPQKEGSVLRLYRMAKLQFAETTMNQSVVAAAITAEGQVAVVCRGAEGFTYQLLDPAGWQEKPISSTNDLSAVLGFVALPEFGKKDETDTYAKKISEQYNVRFLYESCEIFDAFGELGLSADLCTDRERILHTEKQLVKSFNFLPDAVWKNIGGELPFIVLLCQTIPGNMQGISFQVGGYNCIFVEIGGNDSFYTNIFIHEVGHAISQCVYKTNPELLDGWMKLTPDNVREAVEKGTADGINSLTVEFTPDDKKGNVCYVSAYAMKNPEEDRAETLAKLYDLLFIEKDKSLFAHEVLKKKALYWAKMIRETFPLDSGTVLPFDSI